MKPPPAPLRGGVRARASLLLILSLTIPPLISSCLGEGEFIVAVGAGEEALESLSRVNGTEEVLLVSTDQAPREVDALVLLEWPGAGTLPRVRNTPVFVGVESLSLLPDLPIYLRGSYRINSSGRLLPVRMDGGLSPREFPPGVERGIVSAAGVDVLYSFEDGVPAVLKIGEDPPVVLVCANLTEWAVRDPESLLRVLAEIVRWLEPPTLLPSTFAAVAVGGAAALLSARVLLQRRRHPSPSRLGIEGPRVGALEHPVRAILLSLLQDVGAASASELSDELQIPRSTLSHHLGVMQREGLISSEEMLGERLYYLPGRRRDALVHAALKNPTRRSILAILEREGPRTIRSLSDELGVSTETVKRNVDILERLGLVTTRRVKGKRLISLSGLSIYHVSTSEVERS